MLSDERIKAASELLFSHWQKGRRLAELPPAMRPQTRAEGYAIQAELEAKSAKPLYGWKIAATSIAGQQHINVDGPLAGRILAERVLQDGAEASLQSNLMRVAEIEFAFRMGEDLPPRTAPYATEEVMAAVATLQPAIEIPDSRYEDFVSVGAPQLIADDSCAHLLVVGAATTAPWRSIDLSRHLARGSVEGRYQREGTGANVLGDPRAALTWLANELSQLGTTLRAGQLVTTGTCVKPLEVEPGDTVVADFGVIGRVSARFA
jgi:2-keto-4-pentenoate hydratase